MSLSPLKSLFRRDFHRPCGVFTFAGIILLITYAIVSAESKSSQDLLSYSNSNSQHNLEQKIEKDFRQELVDDSTARNELFEEQGPDGKILAPYDPCLPGLYRDWREFSLDHAEFRKKHGILGARILIDRMNFRVRIIAIFHDGSTRETYEGKIAVGAFRTPTPKGAFTINHIYCYPDVIFFASESQPLPNVYRGLFAPLQVCDGFGRCERYNDLGLHGFELSAHPNPETVHPGLFGPVSGGCVRIADPCAFKKHLITLAGVGKILRNDRGCYHWLKRNVEVEIFDQESEIEETITLAGILEEGLTSLGFGLRSVMNLLGP